MPNRFRIDVVNVYQAGRRVVVSHLRHCSGARSPIWPVPGRRRRRVWTSRSGLCWWFRPAPVSRIDRVNRFVQVEQAVLFTSGAMYLFVPTRWFSGMSTVSVAASKRTARPRSPMAQLPLAFTKMFFDFRSRWAMAGLPVNEQQTIIDVSLPMVIFTTSFTLGADDFHVQVRQSSGNRQGHTHHRVGVDCRAIQVVEERTVFVVICYQPQLSPRPVI